MYSIALKHEQYETYVLTDQSGQSQLEVVPERGGIITRWSVQGRELLYLDQERFANPELTVRGGIPILFPICGNLPDNTYTYNGQTFTLKQHGFARNLPWAIADRMTQDRAGLTLILKSSNETLAVYPFDFEFLSTYWLQGNTLEIVQRFINNSNQPMPFCTGLHPYFTVTDKSQLQFDIPSNEFNDTIHQTVEPFSGSFDMETDEIDVAFQNLTALQAAATDLAQGIRIQVEYDAAYSTLVFWTLKGKDYYCLEPWSAPRNALNTGENLLHLQPNDTMELRVRFSVEFLD